MLLAAVAAAVVAVFATEALVTPPLKKLPAVVGVAFDVNGVPVGVPLVAVDEGLVEPPTPPEETPPAPPPPPPTAPIG